MVLYRSDISDIFTRSQKTRTILTWRGFRKIKTIDKHAVLHDICMAFGREINEQRFFLEEEVAQMRQKIEAEKEKSDADLVSSAPGYVFEELRVLFRELKKELETQSIQSEEGLSNVLEKIHKVLDQDYDGQLRIVDEGEKGSLEQMERLRRRLDRMAKDLQLSEEEAARLRGELAAAYDGGVASIYKTVQGLADNDTHVASKREMLSKLFESNVEIRKQLV